MLHFTQPTSSSTPGLPGATCSATPALTPHHKRVGCSARASLCCCLTRRRQEGHCCLQHADCKSPVPLERCQLPSRSEQEECYRIRAGGMLSDWLYSYTCSFLSLHLPPPFCLLPCSGTGRSSSLPARYITAPACGSRGNYSNRSCKTDIKHQPGNLLALICPLHTRGNSWLLSIHLCVCASVQEEG